MYIGVLYCVEDVGFGIGEINFYFIVVRKIVVFCLKKKNCLKCIYINLNIIFFLINMKKLKFILVEWGYCFIMLR